MPAAATAAAAAAPPPPSVLPSLNKAAVTNDGDKMKRAQELQARIQQQLSVTGLQSSTVMNIANNLQTTPLG